MPEPIIDSGFQSRPGDQQPIDASGPTFGIYEWQGSGPDYLHVHYSDDEAWHVLEGTLIFRFSDRQLEASAGTTVFVPTGVPHAYRAVDEAARYLIILTPRLRDLIAELHTVPRAQHSAVLRKYQSEILE